MILSAKKLGKSTYVFSVDSEKGQVAHANFVSETARSKGIDARTWAAAVAEIVGGKVRVGDTINICKSMKNSRNLCDRCYGNLERLFAMHLRTDPVYSHRARPFRPLPCHHILIHPKRLSNGRRVEER